MERVEKIVGWAKLAHGTDGAERRAVQRGGRVLVIEVEAKTCRRATGPETSGSQVPSRGNTRV